MGRFLDALCDRKYDLFAEVNSIEDLLNRGGQRSIIGCFDKYFLNWPLRNNYVDWDTFFEQTGLESIVENCEAEEPISIDEFTYYAEYVLNLLSFVETIIKTDYFNPVVVNINNVLSHLNFKKHTDDINRVHVIPNDCLVAESAEIVQDNYSLGESIYAYNYREIKGDLCAKADILCRLYKHYETIEAKARGYGLDTLVEDISQLSNKLDVRHAPTKKQKIVLDGMTATEIEEWYDELFRLYLSLIILVDYKGKRKDIKELKAKLG